jgi:hypothetical protein
MEQRATGMGLVVLSANAACEFSNISWSIQC